MFIISINKDKIIWQGKIFRNTLLAKIKKQANEAQLAHLKSFINCPRIC